MEDIDNTRAVLNRQLAARVTADPLQALKAIGAVQRDITSHQCQAVRAAVQHHSWSEIGEALGVTKQAAHHKFAKEWATQLKDELKAAITAAKLAVADGVPERAAEANATRDAVIAELKNASRRRKSR